MLKPTNATAITTTKTVSLMSCLRDARANAREASAARSRNDGFFGVAFERVFPDAALPFDAVRPVRFAPVLPDAFEDARLPDAAAEARAPVVRDFEADDDLAAFDAAGLAFFAP